MFVAINEFQKRNGWTKDRVAISEGPDPRTSQIICRTRIKHTWWTHNAGSFPGGSVIFENRQRLCLATMTIRGKRVYLFEEDEVIDVLWKKQEFKDQILGWMKAATLEDLRVGVELLREASGLAQETSIHWWRPYLERALLVTIEAVGLRDLGVFVGLITMPSTPSAPCSSAA